MCCTNIEKEENRKLLLTFSFATRSFRSKLNEWIKRASERRKKFFFSAKFKRRESETSETFDIMIRLKKDFISINLGRSSIESKWVYARLTFPLTISLPYEAINSLRGLKLCFFFFPHLSLRYIFSCSFVHHVLHIQSRDIFAIAIKAQRKHRQKQQLVAAQDTTSEFYEWNFHKVEV